MVPIQVESPSLGGPLNEEDLNDKTSNREDWVVMATIVALGSLHLAHMTTVWGLRALQRALVAGLAPEEALLSK